MGIYIKGMTQTGLKLRRFVAGAVEPITIAGPGGLRSRKIRVGHNANVLSDNYAVYAACLERASSILSRRSPCQF